jgi:hypothetical protein
MHPQGTCQPLQASVLLLERCSTRTQWAEEAAKESVVAVEVMEEEGEGDSEEEEDSVAEDWEEEEVEREEAETAEDLAGEALESRSSHLQGCRPYTHQIQTDRTCCTSPETRTSGSQGRPGSTCSSRWPCS